MKNRKKYAENWVDTIRPAILKRDKYKCVKCGLKHRTAYVFPKNEKPFEIPKDELKEWKSYGDKAYVVYLQIAHLDHDVNNNDYSNLAAMCVKCHLNNDRNMNIVKRNIKLK